jgi:hypothetical protein
MALHKFNIDEIYNRWLKKNLRKYRANIKNAVHKYSYKFLQLSLEYIRVAIMSRERKKKEKS